MRFLFTLLVLLLCITATGFVVVAQTNNTNFGRVTTVRNPGQTGGPRVMQIGLKYIF